MDMDGRPLAGPFVANEENTKILTARPENLALNPAEMAVVVVDMQNAYCSPGGYLDQAGFDVSGVQNTIVNIKKVLDTAHAAGLQVIYLQNGWSPDYAEAGGPYSPNYFKSNALKTMRAKPHLEGKLLARGTWDHSIIHELEPAKGDIVVAKTRYSGFFNSVLDSTLRARGIKTLAFVGVATNVCVESSLRDAFHLEYFCVMLEDGVHHIGPDFMREATVYNVEKFFGWVSSVSDFNKWAIQKVQVY